MSILLLSFISGTTSYSGTNTASKSPTSPVYVPSVGNEGSYIQTSPDIAHPITTDEEAINNILNYLPDTHAASNENLLVYSLNQQITSGDLSNIQSTIQSYTASFSASNQSTNPYATPSALFLSDLKAIGNAAASGDTATAKSSLTTAEGDAWTNIAPPSSAADITLRDNANIWDGLEMEGYSASDATGQADAITISGLVGTTGNATTDATRSTEITDIARELTLEAFSPNSKTAEASYTALSNIVDTLLGTTSTGAANTSLASLDKVYG